MTILCSFLVVALISVIGISFWRERNHKLLVTDLLDRVMARSYGEYVASTKPSDQRPKYRKVLTDEELALLERQRLGAAAK